MRGVWKLTSTCVVVGLISASPVFSRGRLQDCGTALSNGEVVNHGIIASKIAVSPTEHLTSYLDLLVKEGVIEESDLRHFATNLENGEIINPVAHVDTRNAHTIHHDKVKNLLHRESLDPALLLDWSRAALAKKTQDVEMRDRNRRRTETATLTPTFRPVPPGHFEIPVQIHTKKGKLLKSLRETITLTHRIEVMTAPTTQEEWVELMGANPSRHKKGDSEVVVTVGEKKIRLLPQHPVENTTWWSAAIFANQLSELHGFVPVYDFSQVQFSSPQNGWHDREVITDPGEILAEAGLGQLKSLDPYETRVVINAPDGDIYRAEGYRLPTAAELAYLLAASGFRYPDNAKGFSSLNSNVPTDIEFAYDPAGLLEHVWFDDSDQSGRIISHPVRGRQAHIINGSAFYDLIGNVGEWSHSAVEMLRGGVNPTTANNSQGRWVWGEAAYRKHTLYLLRFNRRNLTSGNFNGPGVRLVRTLE